MKHFVKATILAIVTCATAQAQTFALERLTVRFSDGNIVDSLDGQMTITGTLTFAGNGVATRKEQLCVSDICETFSDVLTIEGSTASLSHVLVSSDSGQKTVLSVLNRSPLMLMEYGSNGVIVERWVNIKEGSIEKSDAMTVMPPLPTETIINVINAFHRTQ